MVVSLILRRREPMNNNEKISSPLTRLLLPIDINLEWTRIVELASSIASTVKDRIETVTVLYVMKGRFLSEHMANIDSRIDEIIKSEKFKELKQKFIKNEIEPELLKIVERFRELDGDTPVEWMVKDGKVADQIFKTAEEGLYSTIIMERRRLSAVEEMFLGSVTEDLIHRNLDATFYLAGKELPRPGQSPVRNTIICADGSESSKAAVREAAILIGKSDKTQLKRATIMRVVDIANYEEQVERGEDPEQKAQAILDEAKESMIGLGVPEEIIETRLLHGDPVEAICKAADEQEVDMIFMGRKGRGSSSFAEIVLGSITRGVIHHCHTPTLAIVNK